MNNYLAVGYNAEERGVVDLSIAPWKIQAFRSFVLDSWRTLSLMNLDQRAIKSPSISRPRNSTTADESRADTTEVGVKSPWTSTLMQILSEGKSP